MALPQNLPIASFNLSIHLFNPFRNIHKIHLH
nr:MAG TPA: hypothetical protein [Caudoviricetes sp.]